MIICSCFGTTDREIRAALGPNGTGFCPAGRGCGNCIQAVTDIAQEAHRSENRSQDPGHAPDETDRRPRR